MKSDRYMIVNALYSREPLYFSSKIVSKVYALLKMSRNTLKSFGNYEMQLYTAKESTSNPVAKAISWNV